MRKVKFLFDIKNEQDKTSYEEGLIYEVVEENKDDIWVEGSKTSPNGICKFPKTVENEVFIFID